MGKKIHFLSKNFIFAQLQLLVDLRVFIRFGRLYPTFFAFFFYFSKILILKLPNFILSVSHQKPLLKASILVKLLKNLKMKLVNFIFNFSKKFKQNAKNVGYKRPNRIKTHLSIEKGAKRIPFALFLEKKNVSFKMTPRGAKNMQ